MVFFKERWPMVVIYKVFLALPHQSLVTLLRCVITSLENTNVLFLLDKMYKVYKL